MNDLIPIERIENKIYLIRGRKVMLDRDLAEMYLVRTYNLNKAVKRNLRRFPPDFMFQLTNEEYHSLRFQFGILKRGKHSKYLPHVFTEQGIAMLSSVLNSERAIQVNIQIMRAFIKFRQILATHQDLRKKIEIMERKYDRQFSVVFRAIKSLLQPIDPKKKQIGFIKEEQ
ncbi:MAG: ORF6N domain-containing protein [Candidatus Margulisiibacteriota bacterium]